MARLKLAVLLLAVLFIAGCTPVEIAALRSLAANKGFVEHEMGVHGECKGNFSTPLCGAINNGIQVQHVGVLALDAYCSSTDYLTKQGKCLPPTDPAAKAELRAKLQTAISNLDGIVTSIKALEGGQK